MQNISYKAISTLGMRIIKRFANWLKGTISSVQIFAAKTPFCKFYNYFDIKQGIKLEMLTFTFALSYEGPIRWIEVSNSKKKFSWNITWCMLDMKQNSPLNCKLSPILCYSGYLTNLHFDLEHTFHHLTVKFTSWRDMDWNYGKSSSKSFRGVMRVQERLFGRQKLRILI